MITEQQETPVSEQGKASNQKAEQGDTSQRLSRHGGKRISLRVKFFTALFLFSVVPLFALMMFIKGLTSEVKEDLFQQTRSDLMQQASKELEFLAHNYSVVMQHDARAMTSVLSGLETAVEKVITFPSEGNESVIFDTQFDTRRPYPKDLNTSPNYSSKFDNNAAMRHMRRSRSSGMVSFDHMAFHYPGGETMSAQIWEQARRLSRVQSFVQQVFRSYDTYLFRIYVAMESGLYATYPGHGDLPVRFDPRHRPWYRRAIESGRMTWTSPLLDVATGRLTMTGSLPVQGEDGTVLGVVGLDVLLEEGLSKNTLVSHWSEDTTLMLAYTSAYEETGRTGLRLVAEATPDDTAGFWRMGRMQPFLQFDNAEYEDYLIRAMLDNQSGTIAQPWKGVPSFWAWAPFGDEAYFIAVAPIEAVMRVPNRITNALEQSSTLQRRIIIAAAIIMSFGLFIVAIVAAREITKPMDQMISAARRLADGDFSAAITVRTGDERDTVIEAFNKMGPRLAKHVETQQSLAVAQEVQKSLLPSASPVIQGWEISGTSLYCDETGGDYYDFFPVETRDGVRLSVLVGDVSGHGVSSALLMTTVRALLRGQSDCVSENGSAGKYTSGSNSAGAEALKKDSGSNGSSSNSMQDRVTRVNRLLAHDVYGSGRFMTLFGMDLLENSGEVCWVRAGHDPLMVYDPESGTVREEECVGGLPLGVLDDTVYKGEHRTYDKAGTILFIGTDGIWEAPRASDGMMFGKERLMQLIADNAGNSAAQIRDAVLEALEAWRENAPRLDDVTLVVVRKTETGSQESGLGEG